MLVVASAALYLLGIGFVATLPLRPALASSESPRSSAPSRAADLATRLLLGILCNFTLLLLLRSVRAALVAGALLAALGLGLAIATCLRRARHRRSTAARAAGCRLRDRVGPAAFWIALIVWVGLIAIPILGEPIMAWDARSIWFFHARMFYYAGSLGPDTGFGAVGWHPDYPKLISSLAAELTFVRGLWNEYLPKGALLLLLLPASLATFACLRGPISFAFLLWMSWSRVGERFWDGHADGPLALFGALAALSLARGISDEDVPHGVLAVLCLGVCCALKNEGCVLAVCVAAPAGLLWLWRARRPAWPLGRWRTAYVAAIAAAPYVIWEFEKRAWGFQSQYEASAAALQRLVTRVQDGGIDRLIEAAQEQQLGLAVVPFVLALVLAVATRLRIPIACAIPACAALLYTAILALIYLSSPFDLEWQLMTSADRTLLVPILLWYAAAYCVLDATERSISLLRLREAIA